MSKGAAADVVIPYRPRAVWAGFHASPARWRVTVAHRRAGKTVALVNEAIRAALNCPLPEPRLAYVAPGLGQCKAIAWDYLKRFAGPVPDVKFNEAELRADLPNGGRIRLFGADNPHALRGLYDDALDAASRNLTRKVLPAVRSGAALSGQYGGSRQGIAEGLALSDVGLQAAQNARNLAQSALDSGANLYGGAYENAQNRSAQTATTLAGLALENARANADRLLQADTTNAANGLSGAQLNLQGGQALGALGQQGLEALGQFGATQQQLDALYKRAPLDLLSATSGLYGQMPLSLFNGNSQTSNSTTTEKTSGLGNAVGMLGGLAGQLGFSPFSSLKVAPFGIFK